ncbi:copper amine oxidase domain protein [Peptoniphilus duerdenii ATCC BAA-1640]|uniref:Copper amine oxidase domain protein n=1 Tax=Peptoniphilus duerdenii ATCC BAA-1640 TaxID=862517 RepID=E0NKJ0_9FIRM|nr:copper amine oxidase N-terminal domain-containing protein [Peptoniphilus duerdenii]EFM25694.1 copper amine oxidase domain protein [Peptoniphilus duerdenii ATCC BAA-1640]
MKTKNSKKVLALILSFFMILTVLPFNVMASGEETGTEPQPTLTAPGSGNDDVDQSGGQEDPVAKAKDAAKIAIDAEAAKATEVIKNIADPTKRAEQETALNTAVAAAKTEIGKAQDENGVNTTKAAELEKISKVQAAAQEIVNQEKAAAAKELRVTTNVYYDAITGKVVDGNNNPVKDALVKVLGRTTYTDKDGNFTFNMTSESGNYYCGYYGYYWKDYPYNSYKVDTSRGSYSGNNGSYARYYFLVDGNGTIVDSIYANANSSYYLRGESNKTYTVYVSEYGYGYGYGYDNYKYYDKYYNRYYNPNTSWAYNEKLTASKAGYTDATATLYNVTNNSWLYTTCYEYGYPYGYDRVIYPSALSLSGNGTIVSGKVGVSYLPIYVYRNGVFLGSGNADVNGYFSIGLNSRVSSTSDLTFYAYGKGAVAPEKKSEKADHGVIPVKSTVVIGSTKLIKNINGVEADVNMDVAPFIKDGRTMLPLRYIAEALGFKVDWDRATRTVTLTDKEFKVQIPVETNKIIVNGSTYYSDANPVLRNGRTMLPVANIARALGLKDGTDILWDANTRVATITRLVKY